MFFWFAKKWNRCSKPWDNFFEWSSWWLEDKSNGMTSWELYGSGSWSLILKNRIEQSKSNIIVASNEIFHVNIGNILWNIKTYLICVLILSNRFFDFFCISLCFCQSTLFWILTLMKRSLDGLYWKWFMSYLKSNMN